MNKSFPALQRYYAAAIDAASEIQPCSHYHREAAYQNLRQMVIMKRPYRDVLVWLAGIRPPDNSLSAERATATVIALLAAYERDPKLAALGGALCQPAN
jgi:hypothetical protein